MTTTMLTPQQAIDQARADRDAGMAQAEASDRDGWDRHVIDQAISAFAATGRPFSSNDMRELLPDVRPALIGARFMAASVQGQIRRVGWATSTKRNTHSKPVAVWIRANTIAQGETA